jgi:hypothetical protein
MKVAEFYKGLPTWAKGVVGVVVIGGTAAAVYTVWKSAKRNKDLKDANQAAYDAQRELNELAAKNIKPTMSESQFEVLCQNLVQSMNGCGTDETKVLDVVGKMKNDADIRKLIAKFGVRFYTPCAADQPISYAKWLWDDKAFGGALPTWFSYDLSAGEIQQVNALLKKNGVNYAF